MVFLVFYVFVVVGVPPHPRQDRFKISRALVVDHAGDKFPLAIELEAHSDTDRTRRPRRFTAFRIMAWPESMDAAIAYRGRGRCTNGVWEATRFEYYYYYYYYY